MESSVDSFPGEPYTSEMLSRSTLTIALGIIATLGFGACKSIYRDTFSYRKNNFQPPPKKEVAIKPPTELPPGLDGSAPGGLPMAPGGAMPGAPDAGAIPGIPGADPAAPALPGAAPAVPAVPGL